MSNHKTSKHQTGTSLLIRLLLVIVVGIVSQLTTINAVLAGNVQASSSDTTVQVKVVVPDGEQLSGTIIITIEDITVQDRPSIELARLSIDASALSHQGSTFEIPVDLNRVKPDAMVNAAVHVDTDISGGISDGDWLSDSIVPIITNGKLWAQVTITKIGVSQ